MTNQDREKDAMSIRVEIFKHASTIASALAAIYATFLLTRLNDLPLAFGFLVVSIFSFLVVAGFGVFALANVAWHIRQGNYNLTNQIRFSLILIYALLITGFTSSMVFTFKNASLREKQDSIVTDNIKAYVNGYIDSTAKRLIQDDVKNEIAKELKIASSRIEEKLRTVLEANDEAIREYINGKLQENAKAKPSGGK